MKDPSDLGMIWTCDESASFMESLTKMQSNFEEILRTVENYLQDETKWEQVMLILSKS